MNPVSPIPAVALFVLAVATVHILARRYSVTLPAGRVPTIDGLRGYLGFAVFLHHATIWYYFLRTARWAVPPSPLYTHLGQSGVSLFFMITGFLFFSKLIDAKKRPIDWTKLYISRALRLTPLYLFAMVSMFAIVAILSNGELRDPANVLVANLFKWLTFTAKGAPDINGVSGTFTILAGVTWTLPYEWIFYLALPLMAPLVGNRPPIGAVLIGIAAATSFKWLPVDPVLMKPFAGGIVAAVLGRNERFRTFAATKTATVLAAVCISAVVMTCPTAYSSIAVLLLCITFSLIAAGNSVFGILTNRTSRVLGEIAYSIYLLHGLLLFVVFRFLIGFTTAAGMSPIAHWAVIAACTPALIGVSFLIFRRLESPMMHAAPAVSIWVKTKCATIFRFRFSAIDR